MLLVLNIINIILTLCLIYATFQLKNSNEQVITDICKIEDSLVEIKEYLGEDFQTFHEQN